MDLVKLLDDEAIERFWSKVEKTDGCWNWTGQLHYTGYGAISVHQKKLRTHRVAWAIHHGECPGKAFICHSCDNRRCVNPAHLWAGTHRQNMADMAKKKRARGGVSKGQKGSRRKLSAADVLVIRASTESMSRLALRFGVTSCTIKHIRSGRAWKHLLQEAA